MKLKIEGISKDLYACLQCGYCTYICPVYKQVGWESASPRGKMFYLKQLTNRNILDRILRRNIEISDDLIKRIYQCTNCGACEQICHVNTKPYEIWEKVKDWFYENNIEPPDIIKKMRTTIDTYHSPYVSGFESGPVANRNESIIKKHKLPVKADIVLFLGCVSSYLLIKMMNSALKILRKSGVNYTVLKDEWCCGNILGATGFGRTDTFQKSAQHNMAAVKATGAHTLITSCPGCYRTFSEMYPKYASKPDFEVLHFTELLVDLIDNEKLTFKKSVDRNVAYHDPCELGRLSGIFEPPRKILENTPGINLRELTDNKRNCTCCGNGGGLSSLEPEMALNISVNKINEVMETEADTLVSSCPNCRQGLSNAILEKKKRLSTNGGGDLQLEMMDITELVGKVV
ncbi:MAG: (Fe-S)-binding protein [Thermoplasmata archaeon]|nr:MAG: (Fe-S)-binding protein [Thermoplasmata archaeon]